MTLANMVAYLAAKGMGAGGTNLFYGLIPPTPDAMLTMFEYGGLPNEPVMGGRTIRIEYPLVQLVTRGVKDDFDGPLARIRLAVEYFAEVADQAIVSGGVQFNSIVAKAPPSYLRRDDNFRCEFVCNLQVVKAYG